ncbi:SDR family NAD(P)-dependent oxidoreductase [Streptomyces sp. NBC_00829]|uniref:SDR family NAD(P)-dependent oxidoreductase n=1 Tax=Streptomyces sp. NBC_00829 TaxID=2903679 RepID=UPI0038633CC8
MSSHSCATPSHRAPLATRRLPPVTKNPDPGLITGVGSGIGRATALLSAQRGATLVLCDRDEAGPNETAAAARALHR